MSPKAESPDMKHVVCTICDIGCQFRAEAKDGRLARILPHENPLLAANICFKGVAAPHIHNHEDRLRKPLKRVGERGQDQWEEISYVQAMDEIAERLSGVVQKHGPESFAVSTSGWNTQTTHSTDRRFMNLLGSPQLDQRSLSLRGQYRRGQPDDLWLVSPARLHQYEMHCALRTQSKKTTHGPPSTI